MKKLIALLILTLGFSVNARQAPPLPNKQCDAQVPFGEPLSSKQDTTLICRNAYLLEHDNKAKIPQWVSYTLTPDHTTGCVKRTNAFAADESLPVRSTPKDYAKSGYDIGHMANDGDMSWSVQAERESFILSNMAPQLPGFNRGIWKQLEDRTRAYSKNTGHTVHIYVGPIYSKQDITIGNGVVIPHAFFKIITDLETKETYVSIFPHAQSKAGLSTFVTSLAEVQRQTGLVLPLPENGKFVIDMWSTRTKSVRASKNAICTIR